MPLALITTGPGEVVTTFEATTVDLDLPGIGFVTGVGDGFRSVDGVFALVAFTHFEPPVGKVISGSPTYTVEVISTGEGISFTVTETFGLADAPPPNFVISNLTFRNLFTQDERLAIATSSLTDGVLRLFIDDYLVNPTVDLTSQNVADGCALLVTKLLMTQPRIDEILAFRNP